MDNTFTLTIRTPEGDVFGGKATSVSLSTEGGDMQCFAGHASVTASVGFSPVVVEFEGGTESYLARNGMFLFHNKSNKAVLLALHAEAQSEVSEKTVQEYMEWINEKLASGESLSDFQLQWLEGEKLAVQKQLNA